MGEERMSEGQHFSKNPHPNSTTFALEFNHMSFKSLGLAPALLEILEKQKIRRTYGNPETSHPCISCRKKTLWVLRKRGSGKTASFVLPLLMKVVKNDDYSNRHIKALILAPTRELAIQVHQVIQLFSQNLDRRVKSMAVYGGVSINPQMIGMQNVEILVATPGRLLDLVENKALHLSEVSTFIMDEADKLLNLDFQEELEKILSLLPSKNKACSIQLLSMTMFKAFMSCS